MNYQIRDLATYALAALGRRLTPALQKRISRLCSYLVADVPQLGAAWVVRFYDPTRSGGSRPVSIDARLEQYGRYVRGSGYIQGEPSDPFVYQGVVARNVFYGSFKRTDSHVLAGTGTFVLKIRADSQIMSGTCSWYDKLLDDVWSSEYQWTRNTKFD